jgi:hypothetical protein
VTLRNSQCALCSYVFIVALCLPHNFRLLPEEISFHISLLIQLSLHYHSIFLQPIWRLLCGLACLKERFSVCYCKPTKRQLESGSFFPTNTFQTIILHVTIHSKSYPQSFLCNEPVYVHVRNGNLLVHDKYKIWYQVAIPKSTFKALFSEANSDAEVTYCGLIREDERMWKAVVVISFNSGLQSQHSLERLERNKHLNQNSR